MKKTIAILLALMTMLSFSLMACNKKGNNSGNTDDLDNDNFAPSSGTNSTNSSDTENGTGDGTGTGNNSGNLSGNWVAKAGTVYLIAKSNIRSATDMKDSSIITNLEAGTALERVRTNNIWDEVTYDGKTAYVLSYRVASSKNEFEFIDYTGDDIKEIHVKPASGNNTPQINLRSTPMFPTSATVEKYSSEDNVVCTINGVGTANGELKVVGINKSGTILKVTFDGKDVKGNERKGTFYIGYGALNSLVEKYGGSSGGSSGSLG